MIIRDKKTAKRIWTDFPWLWMFISEWYPFKVLVEVKFADKEPEIFSKELLPGVNWEIWVKLSNEQGEEIKKVEIKESHGIAKAIINTSFPATIEFVILVVKDPAFRNIIIYRPPKKIDFYAFLNPFLIKNG